MLNGYTNLFDASTSADGLDPDVPSNRVCKQVVQDCYVTKLTANSLRLETMTSGLRSWRHTTMLSHKIMSDMDNLHPGYVTRRIT